MAHTTVETIRHRNPREQVMRNAAFECPGCTAKNRISVDPEEGEYQQTVVTCSNCGRDVVVEISIDPETLKISIFAETE